MTIEQGAAAQVKIRFPRPRWIPGFVLGGLCLPFAAASIATGDYGFVSAWLVLSCFSVGLALWFRTSGVDLTPESANIRDFRRRSIPWQQVQAVLRDDRQVSLRVRLILEDGKHVTLQAPTAVWGLGGAQFERDFQRIGQWWVAHRGASWCPKSPQE
jgi:hypothetical protein